MARPIERPEHHYKPFEYTINVEDAFDYLDEFKNSPDYPKKGAEMGILYTPNKYQILGDRLEAKFDIDMIEARKIVGNWFKRNNSKKKKVTKLTESDLNRIVKRVINEGSDSCNYYIIATPYHLEGNGMFIYTGDEGYSMIPMSPWNINRNFIRRIQDEMINLPKCYEKKGDAKHDLRRIKMGTRNRPELDWRVVKLDF